MGKILVVDDALFMRQVIHGILQSGGYDDLLEAADGVEALAQYEQHHPELVILDITMPNLDGIETLRRIKRLDSRAKVIMCTAVGQESQMMRAIGMGAVDYVVKPFKPEALLRVIQKVMGDSAEGGKQSHDGGME